MTSERSNRINEVLSKRQSNIALVLENVHDHHNIAAVMRTCDAVGIQDIYVLNTLIPKHDYFGFQSSRSANRWVTIHQFDNTNECFLALRKKYDLIFATHLGETSISVYDINFTQCIALVFGNEINGVSEETVRLSDGNFIIPQVGMIQSLNISVACAVTIYEAYRQKNLAGHYGHNHIPLSNEQSLKESWSTKEKAATRKIAYKNSKKL